MSDERDVVSVPEYADVHGRPTVAIAPVIALDVDEAAAYVRLQNAAAKVKRLEIELGAARQETAQALGEWSQYAKEQR